jgi:hypothetical protein
MLREWWIHFTPERFSSAEYRKTVFIGCNAVPLDACTHGND